MSSTDRFPDLPARDRMFHRPDWVALVSGSLFLAIAVIALVDRLDVLRLTDAGVWPVLLIGAGLILLASAGGRSRRRESRTIRPLTLDELDPEYRLGAGSLRLDLRYLDLAGEDAEVAISVGVGDAVVAVPPDLAVEVDYRIGMGDAIVLGRKQDGLSVSGHARQGGDASRGALTIRADIRVGDLRVTSPRHAWR